MVSPQINLGLGLFERVLNPLVENTIVLANPSLATSSNIYHGFPDEIPWNSPGFSVNPRSLALLLVAAPALARLCRWTRMASGAVAMLALAEPGTPL